MDTLRLEGSGKDIDLYPWLSAKAKGTEALAGILGFGLPGVENFWFDGAGSGSTWRGARVTRREIKLPVKVYAANRSELSAILSDLSTVFDPFTPTPSERGVARLFFGLADDKEWFVDVVRVGGGDWSRKTDSDDRTYFKTTFSLEAADPFWTRDDPEEFTVQQRTSEQTLLPKIAELRVGTAAVTGSRQVTNVGDTYAWPVFTVRGPATHIGLVGPNGEVLEWDGVLTEEDVLMIDMRANIVEDQNGANRYSGVAPAPRFWSIAPGTSEVSIEVTDGGPGTLIRAHWWPRRWAVV